MGAVLVVDDDSMFRIIMRNHLEALGFSVIEADDGKGVVEIILQERPVACFIDLMMVEQEGIETIQKIADLKDRPRVLAVSSDLLSLKCAVDLGADAYLEKPVSSDAVRSALQEQGLVDS